VVENGRDDADNFDVTSLIPFGAYLYAAIEATSDGAEIWRTSDGVTWEAAEQGGFGNPANSQTGGFAILDGYLYVGTYNDVTGARYGARATVPIGFKPAPTALGISTITRLNRW